MLVPEQVDHRHYAGRVNHEKSRSPPELAILNGFADGHELEHKFHEGDGADGARELFEPLDHMRPTS